MEKSIIFVTIPNVKVSVVYKENTTTIGSILNAFNDSYYGGNCMLGGSYELRHVDGSKFDTSVCRNKTPEDLKFHDKYYLYLNDVSEDTNQIFDNIPESYLGGQNIKITVQSLTGQKYVLDVCTKMPIIYIKYLLYKETGVNTGQQRLSTNKIGLSNEKTIEDYNITGDDTIFLCLKLRAGMWHHSTKDAGIMLQKYNKLYAKPDIINI
jgi:hypothetical protein